MGQVVTGRKAVQQPPTAGRPVGCPPWCEMDHATDEDLAEGVFHTSGVMPYRDLAADKAGTWCRNPGALQARLEGYVTRDDSGQVTREVRMTLGDRDEAPSLTPDELREYALWLMRMSDTLYKECARSVGPEATDIPAPECTSWCTAGESSVAPHHRSAPGGWDTNQQGEALLGCSCMAEFGDVRVEVYRWATVNNRDGDGKLHIEPPEIRLDENDLSIEQSEAVIGGLKAAVAIATL